MGSDGTPLHLHDELGEHEAARTVLLTNENKDTASEKILCKTKTADNNSGSDKPTTGNTRKTFEHVGNAHHNLIGEPALLDMTTRLAPRVVRKDVKANMTKVK